MPQEYTWWTWLHNGILWGTAVYACSQVVEIIFPGRGYWDVWNWVLPIAIILMQVHGAYILFNEQKLEEEDD